MSDGLHADDASECIASKFTKSNFGDAIATKARVPRAADVQTVTNTTTISRSLDAPDFIKSRLGNPPIIMGFDIETHGWPDGINANRKGYIGACGWYTLSPIELLKYARIVGLAWVTGPVTTNAKLIRKRVLVKPNGFRISSKAFGFHGISEEDAHNGSDLAEVLNEFMEDVNSMCSQGAYICAHNLEFDAGIIAEELLRCGMEDQWKQWMSIVRNHAYCTMNPDAGRWIWQSLGRDVGPITKQHTNGLSTLLEVLVPERPDLRRKEKRHQAIIDAEATRLLYLRLLQIVGLAPTPNLSSNDVLTSNPKSVAAYCD